MFALSRIVTGAFDVLLLPFGPHRLAALLAFSLGLGAALALVFRATSNQKAIARAREVFKARILEMRIYPDDIVLITRAFFGALASQGTYLRHAALPILVALVIALPCFIQIEQRFGASPLRAGEHTLVSVRLSPGADARSTPVTLEAAAGLAPDRRPMRVRATNEIVWRVGVSAPGRHEAGLRVGDAAYPIPIEAAPSCRAIGRDRRANSFASAALELGLPALGREFAVESVSVLYDEAHYRLLGLRAHWLVVFLAGSFVGALIPAWILRIQL